MGVVSYYQKEKQRGVLTALKKTFKKIIKRATGVEKIEEENETLFYFLNNVY